MKMATGLAKDYPARVLVAKYEEIATSPKLVIPVLLKVLLIIFYLSSLFVISYIVPWPPLAPCLDQVHIRPHGGGPAAQHGG